MQVIVPYSCGSRYGSCALNHLQNARDCLCCKEIQKCVEWVVFQKISIPIPLVASRNSEGERGYMDWNSEDMGALWTGIPKAWDGGFQESNFQFGAS